MGRESQIEFSFKPDWQSCPHRMGFVTMAYVPAGDVCSECGALLSQFIPESPLELGYISADWKWHWIDGKPWTTKEMVA